MNSSTTSNVRDCIRRRHDLEYLLLGDLRQLLEERRTPHTRAALLATLDHLLEHLPRQLKLQSTDGYMSDVVAVCPQWEAQVEALRRADIACYSLLQVLRDHVLRKLPFARIASQMRRNLRHWMHLLATHRQQEGEMLQEAFTVDLGGEG